MILTKLKEYAEQQMENLPPAMYNQRRIAWLISLTIDGIFEGSICWKDNSQKETKKGREIVAPDIGRTVGVKPKLLVDTSEYILGIGRAATKPDRLIDCHEQFKTLIQACAEATNEPTIIAIAKFLNSPIELEKARDEFLQLLDTKKFDPTENITFRVGSKIPANAAESFTSIQEFWANYTSGGEESESGKIKSPIMTCLVTGEEKAVEQRLPFLVKGLFGGQPSGTALVSANAQAFTSYGLANSLTSPISREAAEKFTKALNHLLSGKNTRLSVGNTAYVFWTREPEDTDFLAAIEHPDPQVVKNLLDSAAQGQEVYGTDVNQFYALALSASVARAVVRDWLETTVPTVKANLKLWFLAHKITDAYGEVGKPLGVYALAASAYRDATKEMLPKVPTALIRNALQHLPIPDDLLTRAVQRNRAEGKVTYPRAALIKLALTTKLGTDAMTDMEQMNPQPNLQAQDDRAYHCGRLLAELEGLQKAAIGKVNASLVDRYYSAASTTPATAFPALMKNSFNHLANKPLKKFIDDLVKKAGKANKSRESIDKARNWMCREFYDVRMFGAVMSTGLNAGQVRGPIQLTFSRSLDEVQPQDLSITRMAVTDGKDRDKLQTMGRKTLIPYGLYRGYGFYSPCLAAQTGVDKTDLKLFWDALMNMWDLDQSASRGLMALRGLHIFSHDNKLGNAPAHVLFDRIKPELKSSVNVPRKFTDYTVTIQEDNLPTGVTLTSLVK